MREEKCFFEEVHYIILLIDSSQSMLWPYLEDSNNCNNSDTSDYKQAVAKVQEEMKCAHRNALSALRNCKDCRNDILNIYQYTFNHHKKLLNEPELLSRFGSKYDKVIEITEKNYIPDGRTALLNTVEESLRVIYDQYLQPAAEKEKRIDKVSIGVITDGSETMLTKEPERSNKIDEIRNLMKKLRGTAIHKLGGTMDVFLNSSVVIGLTSEEFTLNSLRELKEELGFDSYININQQDAKSIRKAFNLWSTEASSR